VKQREDVVQLVAGDPDTVVAERSRARAHLRGETVTRMSPPSACPSRVVQQIGQQLCQSHLVGPDLQRFIRDVDPQVLPPAIHARARDT